MSIDEACREIERRLHENREKRKRESTFMTKDFFMDLDESTKVQSDWSVQE